MTYTLTQQTSSVPRLDCVDGKSRIWQVNCGFHEREGMMYDTVTVTGITGRPTLRQRLNIVEEAARFYSESASVSSFKLPDGSHAWFDVTERYRLQSLADAASRSGAGSLSIWLHGTEYTVITECLTDFLCQYDSYTGQVYDSLNTHLAAIRNIGRCPELMDTLYDYDFMSGYPDCLTFDGVTEKGKETEDVQLRIAKADKSAQIRQYDSSTAVNSFVYMGEEYWLDKATRVGLKNSTNDEMAMGRESTVLCLGNKVAILPCASVLHMLSLLEVYAKDCYNVTAHHLAAVDSMNAIEAVIEYDYTIGYPQKLEF